MWAYLHLWKSTLAAVPKRKGGSPSGCEATRQEATAQPGEGVTWPCTTVAVPEGGRRDFPGKMPGLSILQGEPSLILDVVVWCQDVLKGQKV